MLFILLFGSVSPGADVNFKPLGTVVDAESKFPLPDAMLICDNVQAFSDEYGQFEMDVEIIEKSLRFNFLATNLPLLL